MGLFESISKLTHPTEKSGWIETNAFFTGKCKKAALGKPGPYIQANYNEYQIRYYTIEVERLGWYIFYPLPDPDLEEIKDTSIRIRYNERKPWEFEAI